MRAILLWLDPRCQGFWRVRVTILAWITVAAGALILYAVQEKTRHVLFMVDWCNVLMHEAGHPIFGVLGVRWLTVAGGTILQLLMPALFYFYFLRRAQPKSADVCLFWFGTNFLGIGPYIADARAQALPLLGSGEHDWTYLLESAGLLTKDVGIGAWTAFFGCFVMAYAAYCLYFHLRKAQPALLA